MFGAGATENYTRQVSHKTGLATQDGKFVGTFQGYSAWSGGGMVADAGAAVWSGGSKGLMSGIGALVGGTGGGMLSAMSGGGFFMKYDYVIELPGWQLPGGSLRETSSFMVNKSFTQRTAIGQKCSSGVAWIDQKYEVSAKEPGFIAHVCSSTEFQQWLQHWPYLNLSWEPQRVWLELMDSPQRISSKFSATEQQNGDMVFKGLSVVAAAVRACLAR